MKIIKSLGPPRPPGTPPLKRRGIYPVLTVFFLSSFSFLFPPLSAQVNEKIFLTPDSLQKRELEVTPEIEKKVLAGFKDIPEEYLSKFGIKNKSQLENLHIDKPIPCYHIVNEELEPVFSFNVSRRYNGKPLSLELTNIWNVPVMCEGDPHFFGVSAFSHYGGSPRVVGTWFENITEHFQNYEDKDSIIGSLEASPLGGGIDFLIIRKENKVLFVQVYDEATGKYFKKEYGFSELINPIKELDLREKEAKNRYYAKIANKSELEMTPEITKMLISQAQSYWGSIRDNEEYLSQVGIKNRAHLEHLHLEKPIPMYRIVNETLTFIGEWQVMVMSDDEPLFFTTVKLEDDGQYRWAGSGGAGMAEIIHNHEHRELVMGFLVIPGRGDYLIIRKENKDIFVKSYDWDTGEVYKKEYSFSEIINLFKK